MNTIKTGDTVKSTRSGLTFLIAGHDPLRSGWVGFTDNGVYSLIPQDSKEHQRVPNERIMTIPAATWCTAMDKIAALEKEKDNLLILYNNSQALVKELETKRFTARQWEDKLQQQRDSNSRGMTDRELSDDNRGQH